MNLPRGRVVLLRFRMDPSERRRVFIIYVRFVGVVPSEGGSIDLLQRRIQGRRSGLLYWRICYGLQITWGMKC